MLWIIEVGISQNGSARLQEKAVLVLIRSQKASSAPAQKQRNCVVGCSSTELGPAVQFSGSLPVGRGEL